LVLKIKIIKSNKEGGTTKEEDENIK